ncbi:putative major capsid protein [Vibrio phage CKB-S2]|nr:putative major capsid protein [Vibrio phage CKB-S2]
MANLTRDVSPAFVQLFESEVHQAYQEEGDKLAATVRTKSGVVGSSVNFPIFGKGAAQDRGASASDVPIMGVGNKTVKCDLAKKIAADYSDVFDEVQLNFDDRQELAVAIGYAMRRCEDQMIIDAMDTAHKAGGAKAPNVVAADFGASAAGPLSIKKVKRAQTLLNRKGVPRKDRYLVYTPDGLDALLDAEEVTTIDKNNVKALVDGDVDTYLGFKFIMINDETVTVIDPANPTATHEIKTGLPGVGTADRKYFAYHRRAVGYANGIDKTTMADWVAQKASYLIQSHLFAGSVVIDPEGYVTILCKETV